MEVKQFWIEEDDYSKPHRFVFESDHLATVQALQARIVELDGIVSLVNEILPTIKTASSDSRNQLFALIELTKEPK